MIQYIMRKILKNAVAYVKKYKIAIRWFSLKFAYEITAIHPIM